ncbi:MAG: 4Fe-4S ferredoxin [Dehalococcoidales bacterium]|nr:4Fe-4S ferredoxin [Dehalococcoidales bacterium]|tara:strand:+ start:277 stop:993 length:717 start_codon:yes stop_codon:yes gene_type:complete
MVEKIKAKQVEEQVKMINIYIMGKHYQVPEGLTILTAMEYCGYRLIRGCGCRAGFCGACATVFNFKDDPQLRYDLACQKTVEPDMYLVQIPFFPAAKALYNLEEIEPDVEQILALYPDLVTCFGCNNCTKTCPQELEVMWFMSDALRGDIGEVATKSFDCVMCGLCAARCPQGLVPYNVALLCRRLYGRYLAPVSKHLEDRIAEIEAGKFDAELEKLEKMEKSKLQKLYDERDIEPAY